MYLCISVFLSFYILPYLLPVHVYASRAQLADDALPIAVGGIRGAFSHGSFGRRGSRESATHANEGQRGISASRVVIASTVIVVIVIVVIVFVVVNDGRGRHSGISLGVSIFGRTE
jgi:hypothetical protein